MDSDIQRAVDQTIREILDPVRIVSVDAVDAVDFDGDDILRVTVVVDSPVSEFDIAKLSSLVRHVRDRLDGLSDAFPMISFRSREEAGVPS